MILLARNSSNFAIDIRFCSAAGYTARAAGFEPRRCIGKAGSWPYPKTGPQTSSLDSVDCIS